MSVVGFRPTCFSSDLQESPESGFSATLKATTLSGFPGVSSLLLTGLAEPPRPQLAGSPLVRRVYLKGRPRPEAKAAHSAPRPPSGRQVSPALTNARPMLTEKDPALLRSFMALAVALSLGHRYRQQSKMVSDDRVSQRALRACPRPLGRAALYTPCAPLLREAGRALLQVRG